MRIARDTSLPMTCNAVVFAIVATFVEFGSGCASYARPAPSSPHAEGHVARALTALKANDLVHAEAALSLALEYAPGLATAHNGLGLVAVVRGDDQRAKMHFQRALRSEPDLAEAHSNLGALALRVGRVHDATQSFYAALAIDPGYPGARHNLARALLQAGDVREARRQFLLLTSADPMNPDAWAELGLVETILDQRAAADVAIRKALTLAPHHLVALRARGDLARSGGDSVAALADYTAILSVDSEHVDALVARGITRLVMGTHTVAVADLTRAVRLAPDDAAARFGYGIALATMGDDRGALVQLDAAIALRGALGISFAEANYMRAQILERLGQHQRAKAAYQLFLVAAQDNQVFAAEISTARRRIARLSVMR